MQRAELVEMAIIGALGLAGVAVDAIEGFSGGFVEEGTEAVDEEVGFEAAGAFHVPGGVEEVVEGEHLQRALRSDFIEQRLFKFTEGFLFVFADDEVLGRESVFQRIA